MAGGVADDIRTPYPKGEDGLVLLTFGPVLIPDNAESSDFKFDAQIAQFAFKAVRAEFTAVQKAGGSSLTLNLEDDTGSPQVLLANVAVTDVTDGAATVQDVTSDLVKTITINAGAKLTASFISASSDTADGLKIRLWVKPVY